MLQYYDISGIFGIWIAVIVVSCIISIAIAVWVYRDAKERDMNETMWLLIILLTGCIGCIIYLIVRE
ncbi:MAG: PLDc N-terminal domain-containing protein [Promethearchaeia archaeon]